MEEGREDDGGEQGRMGGINHSGQERKPMAQDMVLYSYRKCPRIGGGRDNGTTVYRIAGQRKELLK